MINKCIYTFIIGLIFIGPSHAQNAEEADRLTEYFHSIEIQGWPDPFWKGSARSMDGRHTVYEKKSSIIIENCEIKLSIIKLSSTPMRNDRPSGPKVLHDPPIRERDYQIYLSGIDLIRITHENNSFHFYCTLGENCINTHYYRSDVRSDPQVIANFKVYIGSRQHVTGERIMNGILLLAEACGAESPPF